MTVTIRSERLQDYHRIAEINALAFTLFLADPPTDTYVSEFMLVDALRHGARYDPELSLVAEMDGQIVGHALFYPVRTLVGGLELLAVSLGPIAVDPPYQGRGIGARLIAEGHLRARDTGAAFSFLLGHPTYYPRFGYLPGMFGECCLEIGTEHIPGLGFALEKRLVQSSDLDLLLAMWQQWFHDVDLALMPEASVLGWISHTERVASYMLTKDGAAIGYLRHARENPADVKLFLARDEASTLLLLSYLKEQIDGAGVTLKIPLHPEAGAVKNWFTVPYEPRVAARDYAMIYILDAGYRTIVDYCDEVGRGERRPGLLVYPPPFEMA